VANKLFKKMAIKIFYFRVACMETSLRRLCTYT